MLFQRCIFKDCWSVVSPRRNGTVHHLHYLWASSLFCWFTGMGVGCVRQSSTLLEQHVLNDVIGLRGLMGVGWGKGCDEELGKRLKCTVEGAGRLGGEGRGDMWEGDDIITWGFNEALRHSCWSEWCCMSVPLWASLLLSYPWIIPRTGKNIHMWPQVCKKPWNVSSDWLVWLQEGYRSDRKQFNDLANYSVVCVCVFNSVIKKWIITLEPLG